jgi:RNA polymerase primary sigma factor
MWRATIWPAMAERVLADDLAEVLAASPGLTDVELAARLGGLSEAAVRFALFAGHGRFSHGKGQPPRWSLATVPSTRTRPSRAPRATSDRSLGLPSPTPTPAPSPARGAPTPGLALYPWQRAALDAWVRAGRKGVVEAVTGTGKTRLGVAAALAERERRGQVLVLVPTADLQSQWVAELSMRLPPSSRVGRLGDGAADNLSTHDVLVAVVNSARGIDVRPIRAAGLLVADECHRYGSAVNHLALDSRFQRRLGLSATYGREDNGTAAWLDPYFGGTCFRLGYERAKAEAVTARFTVTLLGVRLDHEERATYDDLTRLMGRLWARLVGRHGIPAAPFDAFLRGLAALAGSEEEGSHVARSYRQAMLERRRLLADTPAKDVALSRLGRSISEAQRAIVFTQSIAASERVARLLEEQGLRSGVVHSGLARDQRRSVLSRFADGALDVLAAPRVLDEGIDVPAADLAVIAGASRTRRQMVQRMGRILRRKADGRRARFAVLFVEETVEDPAHGAHEVFLEELVGVADKVRSFSSRAQRDAPAEAYETLLPAWP